MCQHCASNIILFITFLTFSYTNNGYERLENLLVLPRVFSVYSALVSINFFFSISRKCFKSFKQFHRQVGNLTRMVCSKKVLFLELFNNFLEKTTDLKVTLVTELSFAILGLVGLSETYFALFYNYLHNSRMSFIFLPITYYFFKLYISTIFLFTI